MHIFVDLQKNVGFIIFCKKVKLFFKAQWNVVKGTMTGNKANWE